jgi:hypothetical protein
MRENRNLRKSKNLRYVKTFESFGKDYHLMLEEESWLSKGLATLAMVLPFFGLSKTDANAMQVVKEEPTKNTVTLSNVNSPAEEKVELKKSMLSEQDTAKVKTFLETSSAGKTFNLTIQGFKPENVIIKEVQMDRNLFEKEVITCFYTTSALKDTHMFHGGQPEAAVIPKFVKADRENGVVDIVLVNNGIEPDQLVIQVSVEKDNSYDAQGNVSRVKTKWTINGQNFEDFPVHKNDTSERILN